MNKAVYIGYIFILV